MKTLLLLGAGHAHWAVIRLLQARGIPEGWRVVLLCPEEKVTYSGMLPGYLAGHFSLAQLQIEIAPQCQAAQISWRQGRVARIQALQQQIVLEQGEMLDYDLLSVDIGSLSLPADWQGLTQTIWPIRPLGAFITHWQALCAQWELQPALPCHLAILGAGAAGVELALALAYRRQHLARPLTISLYASERGILPGHPSALVRRLQAKLRAQQIEVHCGALHVVDGQLCCDGAICAADHFLGAVAAHAPEFLRHSQLALDEQGFIAVQATQQSTSDPKVFATGDVASRVDLRLAKSGVHAVHAGPVLAENLWAAMQQQAVSAQYRPRSRSLYLLATGPKEAVLSWGRWHWAGRWVWSLKRWIDLGFIAKNSRH